MRISIHTLGTRGDVQPYLALAMEFMKRGHEVQLAAPVQFERMIGERGVRFAPLPGDFLALLDSPQGKAAVSGGQGFSAGFKLLKYVRPLMLGLMNAEWEAAKVFMPGVIVAHPKSVAAPHMAEALSCPFILASPVPGLTPTSAFPSPLLPFDNLGPLNRASHKLAVNATNILFGKTIRKWRTTTLGLSDRLSGNGTAGTLYAYSRHLLPVPADWGDEVLVSGYWFLPHDEWQPPPELAAFLEDGDPPVYVGFGSMPAIDRFKTGEIFLEALAKTGKRGLLASGGGALGAQKLPSNVRLISEAPHDWLFPKVAAVIHHGGAGTTAASLRAGKPTSICPFFGDQPFWAKRVAKLGLGPPALNRKSLSADSVVAAIRFMEDSQVRHRAEDIARKIGQEDGVAGAADFIEARVRKTAGDQGLISQ
ncbi:MAG: glycosyltransferase [Acidobacteriota bacterium]